jgi:predicted DNA-binding WGR domain protein
MIKLYRKHCNGLEYWEAWETKGEHTVHWGLAGDRGTSETVRGAFFRSAEKTVAARIVEKRKEGFQEIDDLETLMIEYAIEGMGTTDDLDKRHRLEERMNETLGWTGLGNCDGGSIGTGTMEVCCFVVDFEIAAKTVAADLAGTEFANFTRIYLEE